VHRSSPSNSAAAGRASDTGPAKESKGSDSKEERASDKTAEKPPGESKGKGEGKSKSKIKSKSKGKSKGKGEGEGKSKSKGKGDANANNRPAARKSLAFPDAPTDPESVPGSPLAEVLPAPAGGVSPVCSPDHGGAVGLAPAEAIDSISSFLSPDLPAAGGGQGSPALGALALSRGRAEDHVGSDGGDAAEGAAEGEAKGGGKKVEASTSPKRTLRGTAARAFSPVRDRANKLVRSPTLRVVQRLKGSIKR
jgi:hypothetical protein